MKYHSGEDMSWLVVTMARLMGGISRYEGQYVSQEEQNVGSIQLSIETIIMIIMTDVMKV